MLQNTVRLAGTVWRKGGATEEEEFDEEQQAFAQFERSDQAALQQHFSGYDDPMLPPTDEGIAEYFIQPVQRENITWDEWINAGPGARAQVVSKWPMEEQERWQAVERLLAWYRGLALYKAWSAKKRNQAPPQNTQKKQTGAPAQQAQAPAALSTQPAPKSKTSKKQQQQPEQLQQPLGNQQGAPQGQQRIEQPQTQAKRANAPKESSNAAQATAPQPPPYGTTTGWRGRCAGCR